MVAVPLKQIINSLSDDAGRLLRWWIAALRAATPKKVLTVLSHRAVRFLIEVESNEIRVLRIQNGATDVIARQRREDTIPPELFLCLYKHAVSIRLTPSLGYVRRLILPLAAERDLKFILLNEIDRQTPFSPDQTYFDYSVASRDDERQQLSVDLVIAKRSVVDPFLLSLQTADVSVQNVTIATASGESSDINLLRFAATKRRFGVWGKLNLALTGCVVALGIVAVEQIYARIDTRAKKVDSAVTEMRKRAGVAFELEKQIQQIETRLTFLDKKRATSSNLAILDSLTRSLPDDVWLTQLQITPSQIRFSGYAKDASPVVPIISSIKGLQNPHFTSPVTRVAGKNLDRFDMIVERQDSGR